MPCVLFRPAAKDWCVRLESRSFGSSPWFPPLLLVSPFALGSGLFTSRGASCFRRRQTISTQVNPCLLLKHVSWVDLGIITALACSLLRRRPYLGRLFPYLNVPTRAYCPLGLNRWSPQWPPVNTTPYRVRTPSFRPSVSRRDYQH